MTGIRANLLRAFLGVIGGLAFGTVVLLGLNYQVVQQYKELSDTLIAEYRLVDSLSGLIAAYNARVISTNVNEAQTNSELRKSKEEVARLTAFLDTAITDRQAQVSYIGLKNSIDAVVTTIDKSIQSVSQGDIENFTADYYKANDEYQFVRDNGTTLIFDELKYASSILDAMNRRYQLSQILGLMILLMIVAGCALYVFAFARRLTLPLRRLQQLALQIAAGDLDVRVDTGILSLKNELGSLGQSFQTMAGEIGKANQRVTQSQEQLKERADDLEKMNRLMVGRELKMMELKKEVDRLKGPPA